MARTIVALYDDMGTARKVVDELVKNGISRTAISLAANDSGGEFKKLSEGVDSQHVNAGEGSAFGAAVGALTGILVSLGALVIPGVGPVLAAGPIMAALGSTAVGAGIGAAAGGLLGALVGAGVPEEDAHFYSEGVRRGGTLVMVNSPDDNARTAYDIMQRHGAADINERGTAWRKEGWQKFDQNAQPYNQNTSVRETRTTRQAQPAAQTNRNLAGESVVPVVNEEIQVGKRQVEGGGVRINTQMVEKPVQEQVQLREEHVNVERRPVNREVTRGDLAAFEEGVIEVTATSEQAVVSKQARVVEEIVVSKDVANRTETINDSVRQTEVQVEQIPAGNQRTARVEDTNVTRNQQDQQRTNNR